MKRFVVSVTLLLSSTSLAEDDAAAFKRLFIRPIYDTAAKCQPLGGYQFYVPIPRPDGTIDATNSVVVMTELIRSQIVTWYSAFLGVENISKLQADAFSPLCVGLYDDVFLSGEKKGQPNPNAFATDKRHILVGRNLLNLIARGVFGGEQETALLFVLAHEFGHHLQFQFGQTYSEPTARTSELQADCLAGYILGSNEKTAFSNVVYVNAKETAGKLGDFKVLDPNHHGTPAERSTAFKEGLTLGNAGRITDFMENKNTMPRAGAAAALRACRKYASDQQKAK